MKKRTDKPRRPYRVGSFVHRISSPAMLLPLLGYCRSIEWDLEHVDLVSTQDEAYRLKEVGFDSSHHFVSSSTVTRINAIEKRKKTLPMDYNQVGHNHIYRDTLWMYHDSRSHFWFYRRIYSNRVETFPRGIQAVLLTEESLCIIEIYAITDEIVLPIVSHSAPIEQSVMY